MDEVSYLVGNNAFIGDAIPVKGDIPIYVNRKETIKSLNVLSDLCGIETFYPAWDRAYSFEMLEEKIEDAFEIVRMIGDSVAKADKTKNLSAKNLSELVEFVCEDLKMPMLKSNLLFERTILSYFDR